jgi:hypothetical protein
LERREIHIGYWWESQKERPIGKPKHRWVDYIKMDLREIKWSCMNWIDLAQDRDQWRTLVNTIMNLRVPLNVGKFLSSCTTGGFSRKAHPHGVALQEYTWYSFLSAAESTPGP